MLGSDLAMNNAMSSKVLDSGASAIPLQAALVGGLMISACYSWLNAVKAGMCRYAVHNSGLLPCVSNRKLRTPITKVYCVPYIRSFKGCDTLVSP